MNAVSFRRLRIAPGFTLLELVLAVAIGSALLAAALVGLTQAIDFGRRTSGRVEVERQARLIFSVMEADLQSLVWRPDGGPWLVAIVQPDQPEVGGHAGMLDETWTGGKPRAGEGSWRWGEATEATPDRFGQAGMWWRLIGLRSAEPSNRGLPVVVSYQIVRRRPAGLPAIYQLLRAEVPAADTFGGGYNLGADGPYSFAGASDPILGQVRRPSPDAVLAEHVVDIGIRFLRRNGPMTEVVFPIPGGPNEIVFDAGVPPPELAEVFVRVLPREAALRLAAWEASAQPPTPDEWWSSVERHSELRRRQIELPLRAW
jgi:prepilin-type N-terminal cleavage/methylation domain-containing protein